MKLVTLTLVLCLLTFTLHAKTFEVYYLGRQSNMAGYRDINALPDNIIKPLNAVRIFQGTPQVDLKRGGGIGIWSALQPGMG